MHDRRDGGHDRGGRNDRGRDDRDRRGGRDRGEDCGERGAERRGGERGAGPDTRFLQLEMSQLLFAGAETVAKEAFRELLLEAAKDRLRERFGDKLSGLAQLAVDELMNDVFASLDIEARIQQQNDDQERRKDRLRNIFAERKRERGGDAGASRRDDEDREGGGRDDEDRD